MEGQGRKTVGKPFQISYIIRCALYFTLKKEMCKGGKHFLDESTKMQKKIVLVY